MPLSALHVEAAEMAGLVAIGGFLAAGLVLTAPTAAARRRARRRATAGFRLRRRRNFWRYLLGWGELPPPARKPAPSHHAWGRVADLHDARVMRLVFPEYAQEGSR